MSLRLSHTTFDAKDPHTIAEFWRALLDWTPEDDGYQPGSGECYLTSPHGYTVLFLRSPDDKQVKNRAHLDLVPEDGSTRDEQVTRALELGASIVDDRRPDLGWAVMTDPEGNEFCILKG